MVDRGSGQSCPGRGSRVSTTFSTVFVTLQLRKSWVFKGLGGLFEDVGRNNKSSGSIYVTMNLLDIKEFGTIDAENDKRLLDYFVKSNSLERIQDYNKSIIIGRKGTGKTAIYKFLENEETEHVASLLFRDYPWKVHDKFKNSIVTEKESYVNSWLFLIYIELIKLTVKDKKSYSWWKKERRAVRKLEKWLKRNWGSSDFNHKKTMNPGGKGYHFNFEPKVLGNSLGSLSSTFKEDDQLGNTLTEINKKLEDIILKLAKFDKKYILLFDELDLGYDPNDDAYLMRIIGLLLAAYFCYSNLNRNIRVYLFLRSDIFELIEFQDKNKIRDNLVEVLNWNYIDETDNLSLKSIVSKRIEENTGARFSGFNENWNLVFEDQNIGSNQKKWNYISDRTFLRPRDYIKFLNLSLEAAKKRIKSLKEGDEMKNQIINKDIHEIKRDFSEYLYIELKDEVIAKYPNFDSYLEVLRDLHSTTFTLDDFNLSSDSVRKRYNLTESNSDILERLYEFSIIGFYKPGGGGYGGSTYCFKYTDPNITFNPRGSKYQIHSGFKEYLELVG